jgi:uncharacterized protein YdaU (DUF1376 family)
MDYWRRYEADYLADTQELSMVEDGAYGRMLGYYYSKEKPLPTDLERIYAIARANKPAEQTAVRAVLKAYFVLEADGYHNARADFEISVAVPKIEKLRETARANGKKSKGRPKKPDSVVDNHGITNPNETKAGYENKPTQEPEPEPDSVYTRDMPQPLSAIRQPEDPNPRFPGDGYIPASQPPPTAEGREQPQNPEALARILLECKRAKVEDATEDNAIIARWIHRGTTPAQVAKALTEARAPGSKPHPQELRTGYVDTILQRVMRQDAEAAAATEARLKRTQAIIAEGIEAKAHAVPKPDDFPKVKRASA